MLVATPLEASCSTTHFAIRKASFIKFSAGVIASLYSFSLRLLVVESQRRTKCKSDILEPCYLQC